MPTAKKTQAPAPPEAKTIAWFAREIQALTPQNSILDATSLGIWTIAEQSGVLAGEWKQHRILMHDLDTEAVAVALGALLAAIAQTTAAIGLPLEKVMQQQVQRAQAAAPTARVRKEVAAPKTRAAAKPPLATAPPAPAPNMNHDAPDAPKRRRGRPAASNASTPLITPPPAEASAMPSSSTPDRPKRGRPPKQSAQLAPALVAAPTQRPPKSTKDFQPPLLAEPTLPRTPKMKRVARANVR